MLWRTLLRMLRCTSSRLVLVRAAVINSIESRNRVRRRRRGRRAPAGPVRGDETDSGGGVTALAHQLVSHAMHRSEVYRAGRVPFQFLAEFENVVIHGPG